MKDPTIFNDCELTIIDSIGYIDDNAPLCFWLYEQAILNSSRVLLGGCSDGEMTSIFS